MAGRVRGRGSALAKGSAIGEAVKVAAGCLIATGATLSGLPVPPGTVEAIFAGHAWFEKLSFTRRRDLQRVLARAAREVEAEMFAWVAQSSRTSEADLAHAQASCAEALPQVMPVPADLVGRNLAPPAIADLVLQRAETLHAAAYKDKGPKDPTSRITREFLRQVIERSCAHLLADPAFIDDLRPVLWRELLERTGRIEDNTDRLLDGQRAQDERLTRIEVLLASMGDKAETARASGITDEALIELARRVSADVSDPQQAFRELGNAVEIAIRVQQEGRQGSNLGEFLDEVLRRVALLAARGAYDEASAAIDAALAEEEEEERRIEERREASRARSLRLLDAGLEQDLLRRDAESAATRLVRKAKIELPEGVSLFDHLRDVQEEWYEHGRDKGLNLHLEVAIVLARRTVDLATDADQRGTVLTDLCVSLQELGKREADPARLEQAIDVCRLALDEFRREHVPLDWAMVQNNLGNILQELGRRETGTARLEQAVEAFRLTLEEWTRERVAFYWAVTQNNIGIVLKELARRQGVTEQLEQAVEAFRLALEEWTREREPSKWATVQNNLGNALRELGTREVGTARLKDAVKAFRAALQERTRERFAIQWAGTQNNLGLALTELGNRGSNPELLLQAVAAFRLALEEWTSEAAPHYHAIASENLALAQAELDRLRNGD